MGIFAFSGIMSVFVQDGKVLNACPGYPGVTLPKVPKFKTGTYLQRLT